MDKNSLIAVIVSSDPQLRRQMEAVLAGMAEAVWPLTEYPEPSALLRLKEAEKSGCVLFLDFGDPIRARSVAAELNRAYPFVSVVAIQAGPVKETVFALRQVGVRRAIGNPIFPAEVAVQFLRAAKNLKPGDGAGGAIYAFLPAKPGAGATTIATSTAAALARISSQRILLLDFDLRLGVTSFLLKLEGGYSVQNALNASPNLDPELWSKLVCKREALEVLGSAPSELPPELHAKAYRGVLDCAQAQYAAVCVDLPGGMERHEVETLERAKEIFLVCTADVTGLHMAKRKMDALRRIDLARKISVIVNHTGQRIAVPSGDIEKLLRSPVRFSVPWDLKVVANALQKGTSIQGKSSLALQIEAIAKRIAGASILNPVAASSPRQAIEFTSVSPMRVGKR